jgi:hypothetical protein
MMGSAAMMDDGPLNLLSWGLADPGEMSGPIGLHWGKISRVATSQIVVIVES